ncbi:MAG: formate dehydrogenase accessory sulfurtransferase FdhD [Candidatus Firestonebacteria bacterium]
MENSAINEISIEKVKGSIREQCIDSIAKENPITIFLNDIEVVTLLCSPIQIKELAIGYLFSEGLLTDKSDILKITLDEAKGIVWVTSKFTDSCIVDMSKKRLLTTGCGRGFSFYNPLDALQLEKVTSESNILFKDVISLMKEFHSKPYIYKTTGATHCAGLCMNTSFLVFAEDIGRHNAVDKIIGYSIINNILMEHKILTTTGRISSDIILKAGRCKIPIVISRSAPTSFAIMLAEKLNITLVGFARGERFNIYSNSFRIL